MAIAAGRELLERSEVTVPASRRTLPIFQNWLTGWTRSSFPVFKMEKSIGLAFGPSSRYPLMLERACELYTPGENVVTR